MGNSQKKTGRTLYTQILFTALAFIIMIVLSYAFMSTIVRASLIRNAESVLDFAEVRVAAELLDAKAGLERFSARIRGSLLKGDSVNQLKTYINNIAEFVHYTGETEIDSKGYYGYFETLPGGPVLIQNDFWKPFSEDDDAGDFPWYKAAVEANGGFVETVPRISGAGETLSTYAKAILDDEGRRIGIVCIDALIDTIGQEIVKTALNQGGYGMLVNQDLLLLSHPNEDFIGLDIDNPVVPLRIFADDLRSGKDVFEQPMISYKDEDSLVFFRKLSNGWFVGLVTPKNQYYLGMTRMAIALSLLGTTLAVVLIMILIRLDSARTKSDKESKQKSAFLANMSHEIRTPINAIVGMSAIGRAAGTTDRKDYCFAKIDNASKHLLGVINDILDISKIEANKIELSAEEFSFEKILQQVVSVINFRVDEKHQKLTVHIDKAIPRTLFADDQRFAQVVTNLLSNAVKFTPDEGTISLKTTFLGEEDGLCTIKVEVTDTGIGISAQQQAKLFKSFQQAESSTTRRYGGTGLGLSISKSIVEMMDGEIWVNSELGKGATFGFTVKMKRGEDPAECFSHHRINWNNIRILVVDDDPDILQYFQELLAGFGAGCDVASGAGEALRLIEEKGAYNIYFIDLKMPEVDGILLTKEIRAREKNPENSVVIMISSADLSAVEAEAKKAGVNKFLLKPLFPSSVADVISECIGIVNNKMEEAPVDMVGLFAGHHVLFAEDVDINREIVLTLLEPTRIEIDCAENGLEALTMFTKTPEKYDMIFMDVQMPEMDGYEASRKIRSLDLPNAKTIPIIAMTANVFKEDIANCLAAGMTDHLGKPLDIATLLETTLKYLKPNV